MIVRALLASGILFIAAAAAQSPVDDPAAFLPPGRGRDTTIRICSGCHGLDSAVAQYRSHDDWTKTLDQMADNGAQASDAEWDDILAYLDRNFSRIWINKATATELETTLDVGADLADAIVKRRDTLGDFATLDDLKRIPGMPADKIDARKERFVF